MKTAEEGVLIYEYITQWLSVEILRIYHICLYKLESVIQVESKGQSDEMKRSAYAIWFNQNILALRQSNTIEVNLSWRNTLLTRWQQYKI